MIYNMAENIWQESRYFSYKSSQANVYYLTTIRTALIWRHCLGVHTTMVAHKTLLGPDIKSPNTEFIKTISLRNRINKTSTKETNNTICFDTFKKMSTILVLYLRNKDTQQMKNMFCVVI